MTKFNIEALTEDIQKHSNLSRVATNSRVVHGRKTDSRIAVEQPTRCVNDEDSLSKV